MNPTKVSNIVDKQWSELDRIFALQKSNYSSVNPPCYKIRINRLNRLDKIEDIIT